MCDAITMLDGDCADSVGELKRLVPDGDPTLIPVSELHGDRDCLCGTDLAEFLASSARRFKRERCFLSSIMSTWSEVDDQGRTYSDAFDMVPDPDDDGQGVLMMTLVKRDDWPHGHDGFNHYNAQRLLAMKR